MWFPEPFRIPERAPEPFRIPERFRNGSGFRKRFRNGSGTPVKYLPFAIYKNFLFWFVWLALRAYSLSLFFIPFPLIASPQQENSHDHSQIFGSSKR